MNLLQRFERPLAALAAQGWLVSDAESVRVTEVGLLRVDRLLDRFYLSRHRAPAPS